MTKSTSKAVFFIISILYLIIEIGFKGYATQILGDFNVYQYEVESLELIGRSISSFGIAFFIIGFIKHKYKILIFFGAMLFLFFSQKLLFDNIHRLATDKVESTSYQVNLYKSGAYLFPELEKMMLYPYSEKDSIEFKSFVGMLPLLLSGNETVQNFVLMNEELFLEKIKENSFSEKDALSYYKYFDWKVNYPIKSLFKLYGEQNNNTTLVDNFYYLLVSEIQDFSIYYYRRNLEKRKYISKRLSDNLLKLNDYKQKGEKPPLGFLNKLVPELAATIGFDLLADNMITVFKRRHGLTFNRSDFGSFYYNDISKIVKREVKNKVSINLKEFFEKESKRALTVNEDLLLDDILLNFETPKDFFYNPKTKELFKTMDFIFIKDPKDLYYLTYVSDNKTDFIKFIRKYIDKNMLLNKDLTESDIHLNTKMVLVPPFVLLMSTIALYLNVFTLLSTLLGIFINKGLIVKSISFSVLLVLFSLPYVYESNLSPERKKIFYNVFSEKVEIDKSKLFISKWFINNNIIYYKSFESIEDFFMLFAYHALEPMIIEKLKIEGDKNWFLNEIKNQNKKDEIYNKIFKKER